MQADGGEQLEVEILLPMRIGDLSNGWRVGHAGIVHEDVDPPERGNDLAISALHGLGLGDVAGYRQHSLRGRCPDRGGRLLERPLPPRHDGDVGTGCRELLCDGEAEPEAPARHQRFAAFQRDFHAMPLRSKPGAEDFQQGFNTKSSGFEIQF